MQRAGDPQRRRHRQPRADPLEVAHQGQVGAARRPEEEQRAADLQGGEGQREHQRALAEGLGQRHRHQQPGQHHREQAQPHRQPLRVQPVRHPRGEDPDPPDRQHQETGLRRAAQRDAVVGEMPDQRVRQLRDGEDEDEVEEQLDEADLGMAVRVGTAQEGNPGHPRTVARGH